jgi:Flp pilus assembly protein CpaB
MLALPVLSVLLVAPANPPGLLIPPGKQVYSLRIDPNQTVSPFIMPGSKVDVVGTVRKDGKQVAFLAAAKLLVLAVDTTTGPDGKAKDMTVSLAVDVEGSPGAGTGPG